jgi:hypothetical protein
MMRIWEKNALHCIGVYCYDFEKGNFPARPGLSWGRDTLLRCRKIERHRYAATNMNCSNNILCLMLLRVMFTCYVSGVMMVCHLVSFECEQPVVHTGHAHILLGHGETGCLEK